MKTFTAADIKRLKEQGRLSEAEYLKIALSPKIQPVVEKQKPDVLADIRDAVIRIATAQEKEAEKTEEQIIVQSAAPVVNVSVPEEKPEEKEKWRFSVRRDSLGRLETVDAVQL